jgi:hypothetical protein
MSDILETRTESGVTFTAVTDKASEWMRDRLGGKTEVTYQVPGSASDFLKYARAAKLTISAR